MAAVDLGDELGLDVIVADGRVVVAVGRSDRVHAGEGAPPDELRTGAVFAEPIDVTRVVIREKKSAMFGGLAFVTTVGNVPLVPQTTPYTLTCCRTSPPKYSTSGDGAASVVAAHMVAAGVTRHGASEQSRNRCGMRCRRRGHHPRHDNAATDEHAGQPTMHVPIVVGRKRGTGELLGDPR